jgi:hypothetical protein
MRIIHKLILAFVGIASLVGVIGYVSIYASKKTLKQTIGEHSAILAAKIIQDVDRNIYHRIEQLKVYAEHLAKEGVLVRSNRECSELENIHKYILEIDRKWREDNKEANNPFMQELIQNSLSQAIREEFELKELYKSTYGYAVFGEVFVTNRYGANAAQTGKTSDYYQADETWWQNAKDNGLYVADVEYDESAGVYSTDVGIRIDDAKGNFIGVIKAVLNIKEIIHIINGSCAASGFETTQFELVNQAGKVIYKTVEFAMLEDAPKELLLLVNEKDENYKNYFLLHRPGEQEELVAHAHSIG